MDFFHISIKLRLEIRIKIQDIHLIRCPSLKNVECFTILQRKRFIQELTYLFEVECPAEPRVKAPDRVQGQNPW